MRPKKKNELGPTTRVTSRIKKDVYAWLKVRAKAEGISLNGLINKILQKHKEYNY